MRGKLKMASKFDNVKRCLTMLAKALDRVARKNFYNRKQYPEIFFEIEKIIKKIRTWLANHEIFKGSDEFYQSLGSFIVELTILINEFGEMWEPKPGKRKEKKARRIQEQNRLFKSINSMVENIIGFLKDIKSNDTLIGIAVGKGMEKSFDKDIIEYFKKKLKILFPKEERKHTFSLTMILKITMSS
jgi:hypothetical protein